MKISIIVPVFNAALHLDECIESVTNQSFKNWELILVNDGSTDDSELVIKKYQVDERIKYIYKPNSGVTLTRWEGIKNATGDVIMFLDADDVLLDKCLKNIAGNFNEQTDWLSFNMLSFSLIENLEGGEDVQFVPFDSRDVCKLADAILSGQLTTGVCGGAYRKELIIKHKREFCNGLRIAEDLMFNLAFAIAETPRIFVTSKALYGYRTNPESVTRIVTTQRFDAVNDAIRYINKFEKEHQKLSNRISGAIAFRKLLLWSTFMFHPNNRYYHDKILRKEMRRLYPKAFSRLYPYLRVYLFIDLFIGTWFSQIILNRRK